MDGHVTPVETRLGSSKAVQGGNGGNPDGTSPSRANQCRHALVHGHVSRSVSLLGHSERNRHGGRCHRNPPCTQLHSYCEPSRGERLDERTRQPVPVENGRFSASLGARSSDSRRFGSESGYGTATDIGAFDGRRRCSDGGHRGFVAAISTCADAPDASCLAGTRSGNRVRMRRRSHLSCGLLGTGLHLRVPGERAGPRGYDVHRPARRLRQRASHRNSGCLSRGVHERGIQLVGPDRVVRRSHRSLRRLPLTEALLRKRIPDPKSLSRELQGEDASTRTGS
jgi:hypothetical protein